MIHPIEILLINSFAPRQRIASDAGLENGLALIRTYLETQGHGVEVIDTQRISAVERGVPKWCLGLLRLLAELQLKAYQTRFKLLNTLLFWLSWPLHVFSLYCRKVYMEKVIAYIVQLINRYQIPVIGIKVWYGDAFKWSAQLAARVKAECPETVVIAGGPQVKVYGEHVLAGKEFDLAIMGPGEVILGQLLALRRKTNCKQEFLERVYDETGDTPLLITGGYRETCATAEQPDGYKATIAKYRPADIQNKILFHTLVDGFGCSWNKCNFCTHPRHQREYQPRPVHEIIEEMRVMVQEGVGFFRFASSETPLDHGKAIAQGILNAGLQVNYSMFKRPVKVDSTTHENLRVMIKSGLRAVFMGGETGQNLINEEIMNKGTCRQEIIETINCIRMAAAEVGESCRIGLSLIYPCPVADGVTLQDVFEANISLIQQTLPDTVIVNPPVLFPGTKWYKEADKFGFKVNKDFIRTLMHYEYSIYKPAELWDDLEYSLNGLTWFELLKETGRLRKAVMDLGIPTDISDEFLMMMQAIGCDSKKDLVEFKRQSLLDIMTGSAKYETKIIERINEYSKYLTKCNTKQ